MYIFLVVFMLAVWYKVLLILVIMMFIRSLNTSRTCGIVCGLLCMFSRLPSLNCLCTRISIFNYMYFQRLSNEDDQRYT